MRTPIKVALSLLGVAMAGGTWMVWSFYQPIVSAQTFDRAVWLAGAELTDGTGDPGCVRGGMGLNLIATRRLEGMTADEISALLGPRMIHVTEWTYALGQCSGYGWHDSGLVIRFGPDGRAIAARFQHAP